MHSKALCSLHSGQALASNALVTRWPNIPIASMSCWAGGIDSAMTACSFRWCLAGRFFLKDTTALHAQQLICTLEVSVSKSRCHTRPVVPAKVFILRPWTVLDKAKRLEAAAATKLYESDSTVEGC